MAVPERGCAGLPRARAAQRCSASTFEWLKPRFARARLGEELGLRKDHRTVAFTSGVRSDLQVAAMQFKKLLRDRQAEPTRPLLLAAMDLVEE